MSRELRVNEKQWIEEICGNFMNVVHNGEE